MALGDRIGFFAGPMLGALAIWQVGVRGPVAVSLAHVAARQEMRNLMQAMGLDDVAGASAKAGSKAIGVVIDDHRRVAAELEHGRGDRCDPRLDLPPEQPLPDERASTAEPRRPDEVVGVLPHGEGPVTL